MASVTFDKKQLPQLVVMGVLTLGVFGFFVMKVFFPPQIQASTPAPPPSAASQLGSKSGAGNTDAAGKGSSSSVAADGTPDTSTLIGAEAPTDSMRNPFIAVSPIAATPIASATAPTAPKIASGLGMPSIPGLGQIKPLPLPNAGPLPSLGAAGGQPDATQQVVSWQLTGIIQSDTDPSNALAILRDPSNRRYLRLGDQLDASTRLVGIDKNSITLSRNGQRVQLGVASTIPEDPSAGLSTAPSPEPNESVSKSSAPIPSGYPIAPPIRESAPAPARHITQSNGTQTYSHGAAD